MGNRAVITFSTEKNAPCIYLHWNGGRASVEAFLAACRDLSIRGGESLQDQRRAINAMASRIGPAFFGNDPGCTIYVETFGKTDADNGDNGTYIIDGALNIVGREYVGMYGEEICREKTAAIYEQIMARAPVFNY